MNGRAFDAQVVLSPPDSKLGKLLQQYVCARITTMEGIDIALFDFDRHNALYYFMMNADEQIYMRYGGRDAESASTYLNIRSLELALQQGLELHAKRNDLMFPPRPKSLYPRELTNLKARTLDADRCVECHLIADYQMQIKEIDGTLDRLRDLYQSPDIKMIGVYLKVSKGLLIDEAKDAVAKAGMRGGDKITHLEGTRIWTFADLQHRYNKVPRDATKLSLTVEREGKPIELDVDLPKRWWFNYTDFRYWTVEPKTYFKTTPLTGEEKQKLGLEAEGFASRVSHIDFYRGFSEPSWKVGDIIIGVEGVTSDPIANTPDLHIKLRHAAGEVLKVELLRDGEKFTSTLETERQKYRK